MKGYADEPRPLTPRMRDVLNAAADGLTASQTAALYGIGEPTVWTIRAAACRRLEAPNLTSAVARAMQAGELR